MPIAAFVRGGRVRRELELLRGEVVMLKLSVERLEEPRRAAGLGRPVEAEAALGVVVPLVVPRREAALDEHEAPRETTEAQERESTEPSLGVPADAAARVEKVSAASAASTAENVSAASAASTAENVSAASAASPAEKMSAASAASPAENVKAAAPSPPLSAPATSAAPPATFEEQVALVWFTRIGALILLVGVAYFFKYAVDSDWIGPAGRVALGALAGVAALTVAELTRPRTRAAWTQIILGVGLSILFFSGYASFAFYQLVPWQGAFAVIFVLSLLGGALALRHRGEPILILSLAAALAAPILLSTGKDNPLGLFAYLFLVTSLSHAVSLRARFRVAPALAIVGVVVLFMGWYSRFFEVGSDEAYGELGARVVPLLAIAVFVAQWLVLHFRLRRLENEARLALGVLLAASLLGHGGVASLLFDQPYVLGAALVGLALGSAYLLSRAQESELLALPLIVSFCVLLVCVERSHGERPLAMLFVLGLWGLIYVGAFLRGQLTLGKAAPRSLALAGGAGLAILVLSQVLLGERHPYGLVVLLAALSLFYSAIGARVAVPLVGTAAAAITLFMFWIGRESSTRDLGLVALAGLWASVYLTIGGWELLRRRLPAVPLRVLTVSGAGLGFVSLAIHHTAVEDSLLRAVCLAAIGIVDLGLGAGLLKNAPDGERRPGTVLCGQAVALFAAAVAFLWSGATVTVVWAVLAAVVVGLAAGEGDALWLAGGILVFGAAGLRLLTVDMRLADQLEQQFFASNGHEGAMALRFLFNQRALALAGTALAAFVAARASARPDRAHFKQAAAGLLLFGHLLLLTLAICEASTLALALPPLPADAASWYAFVNAYSTAVAAQTEQRLLVTTLVMGLYAAALVAGGFAGQESARFHRYLGLALFGVTVGKLGLYDIWHLARVYQILAFVGIGALLLGASFLYARFGKRLVAILRDGGKGAALLLVFLGAGAEAYAFAPEKLAEKRSIDGVNAPGFYRVEIDTALYRATQGRGFADLRIAGPDGKETPYLVRPVPVVAPAQTHEGTLVDPVELPDGSLRAVVDLGAAGLRHDRLVLAIEGEDYFRRARLEVADEGGASAKWAVLVEGTAIFRLGRAGDQAFSSTIVHPPSDSRYLRVTLLPNPISGPLRITGARAVFAPPSAQPLRRAVAVRPISEARDEKQKLSYVVFELGAAGVPFDAVDLLVVGDGFERRVEIEGTEPSKKYWTSLGGGFVYRSPTGSKVKAEGLHLAFRASGQPIVRLAFSDGDNPPLSVAGAGFTYLAEELLFRAEASGAHTLYVGSEKLAAPTYDLSAVLGRAGEVVPVTASFGALGPNPSFAPKDAPSGPVPFSEKHKLAVAVGLTVLLFGLLLWALRLLRSAS